MNDPNWAYIGAAYALTWGAVLGYLIRVHRALNKAHADFARASQETEHTT
jgi:hypothetical protein